MREDGRILAAPATYASAYEVATMLAPDRPVHLLRPHMIHGRIGQFLENFPGDVAYAVRANFENQIISEVYSGGLDWFACDTLDEIETVARVIPDAKFFFAHPIKSEKAIEEAYRKHRVRAFVLDHPDELAKIRAHTGPDATLLVRLVGPPGALLGEGYRYGCDIERGAWLARAVVDAGYKLGLCYSLGSQVMDPVMYDEAFLLMREVMYRARFMIDMICVGGGFPGFYDGMYPPMLNDYCSVIKRGLSRLHLPRTCRVLATPGRYLVNDAVSVLVRVEQRRGQMLYVNDGLMGSLGSINVPWWRPTVRLVRTNGRPARELDRYLLSGPAGYGNDTMPGPYYLPEDARPGDYLELGQLGAYSGCMTTAFQCIPWPDMVTVSDDPMTPAREDEMPQDMDEPITDEADEEPPYERGGGDEEGEYDEGDDYDDPGQLPRRR